MTLREAILRLALCEPCRLDPDQQVWDEADGAVLAHYCPHYRVVVYLARPPGGVFVFEQMDPAYWRAAALSFREMLGALRAPDADGP